MPEPAVPGQPPRGPEQCSSHPRVGIIGAGVVGKVLAAHLGRLGVPVCVVDVAPAEVATIRARGIRIRGARTLESPVTMAVTDMAALAAYDPQVVFVCVKCTVQQMVAEALEAWDTGRPVFVSFQNGLDPETILCARLPVQRVLRGVVNYAGATAAPGAVNMTFFNPPNHLGALHPDAASAAARVAALLTEAGLDTEAVANIRNKAWRKTILNAVLVPIAVLTRLDMHNIMTLPDTREMVVRLITSFVKVAQAEGQVFEPEFKDNALRYLDNAGHHRASMLMDFEAGTPLEIEYINGRLQQVADEHGIPCDTNRLLLSLTRGLLLHRDLIRRRG